MVFGQSYLVPALVLSINATFQAFVGPITPDNVAGLGSGLGTLKSVPGYKPIVDATVLSDVDFFNIVNNQTTYLVDARGIAKTKDGALLRWTQRGYSVVPPGTTNGTEYGQNYGETAFQFDVASPKYAGLKYQLFVANGRLPPPGPDGVLRIEYSISQVLSKPPA